MDMDFFILILKVLSSCMKVDIQCRCHWCWVCEVLWCRCQSFPSRKALLVSVHILPGPAQILLSDIVTNLLKITITENTS